MPDPAVLTAADLRETSIAGGLLVNTRTSLRAMLREATGDAHERLHHHPGFAAIKARRITLPDYRALLARLLGFYTPFDAASGGGFERTDRLLADLKFLGAPHSIRITVPYCPYVPLFETPGRQLGARYVVEGAALGGQALANELDSLLGTDGFRGRQFFRGRGAATGAAWRTFNMELETFDFRYGVHSHIVKAAEETFETLELWLSA